MAAAVPRKHLLLIILLSAAVLQRVAPAPPPRASASSFTCGWCPRRSTASILPPDAAVCGYGHADSGFHIAAVSAGIFRGGRACGECYQLRCRDTASCAEDGVRVVVVADVADTNTTGGGARGRFLLTKDAFAAMMITPSDGAMSAQHGDGRLASLDTVDVDFRRIPCAYSEDKNLSVRVEEASVRIRGHLSLRFLYQGGQTDIVAAEIAQAAVTKDASAPPSMWRYMTRREGSPGVWRTSRAPAGPLRLRIVVTAGSGGKWLRSDGAVLPADWVPGGVYDTGLRVADVAASTCGGVPNCNTRDEEDGVEELR